MTYSEIKQDKDIRALIQRADESLLALGFTEHSFAHVTRVAAVARYILEKLHFSAHDIELAQIAAYLHDVGNLVNRIEHSQSGATLAYYILDKKGMPMEDIATVVTAIGNHDEGTGVPVNPVAAALILADKSDVRRTRVRNNDENAFDIHDRVNYSASDSSVEIDDALTSVTLRLTVDSHYSSVMDYFEIFMDRMLLCRKAAEHLGLLFHLVINDQELV